MADNLIYMSKQAAKSKPSINVELAKKYFIDEVLPYIGEDSLRRLINANTAGSKHSIQTEMMRMFIESELIKPGKEDVVSNLQLFFNEFYTTQEQ